MPNLRHGHAEGNQMTRIEGVVKVAPGVTSPLFSVAEAAIYLGMSKDWVYERLKALIPHVKIGGALKFRREDLDRYIASQIVAPMNIRDIKSPTNLREVMREKHR
jgi:excisionase family DNA binding protein